MNVTRADRHRLEAIVLDRSAPQKHVWRANIILATAEGCGTAEIMRRSGKSKPVVWRWQARFMAEGVAGLTRSAGAQRGITKLIRMIHQKHHSGLEAQVPPVQRALRLATRSWRCPRDDRATAHGPSPRSRGCVHAGCRTDA